MTGSPPFAAVVLTGGASRRMGTDKAFVEVGGRTLAVRAGDAMRAGGADPVIAVGGDLDRLAALGFVTVADRHPGEGPLGGLITGLDAVADAGGPAWAFVMACDQPGLAAELPGTLAAALTIDDERGGEGAARVDAVVPVVDGVGQVLSALYRVEARHRLEVAFAGGGRAVRRAVAGLAVMAVADLPAPWFVDVDTPDDLDHYAACDGRP